MLTVGFAVAVTDRTNQLKAENTDFVHDIRMDFLAPGVCVGFKGTKSGTLPSSGEIALLEDELVRPVQGGYFIMRVDKAGLQVGGAPTTSEIHFLDVERDGTFDGAAGSTRILLGSPFDQVDPATVRWIGSSPDVFEFTGPLVVWASKVGGGGGGPKSERIIQCSGTGDDPNKVTVTVNR